jgi:hypothetical protein
MSNWKLIFLTLLGGVAMAAGIACLTFVLFALGDTLFVTGRGV